MVTPDLHGVGDEERAALLARVVTALARTGIPAHERNREVKVQIDPGRCQGHGRCYDLAPGLFGEDDEGYGKVLGGGTVPAGKEREARRAASNCPEHAIDLLEETWHGRG